MRLLFVVQRYGQEVFGGAETYAREMATQLAGRGHAVEVLTSCAVSYLDWANQYPAGTAVEAGVRIHRLEVSRPRDLSIFGGFNGRVSGRHRQVAYHVQREWMRQQGPLLPDLPEWLATNSAAFDAVVFVTYLYYSTWAGLPAVRSPSILHPTAHDEPPLYLPIFDPVFRLADGFGFLTEEEQELVRRRFRIERPSVVTGMGIELEKRTDPAGFRDRFGLGDRPYLACVGRIDPNKGSVDLYEKFAAYKRRRPGPLALAMIGQEVSPLPNHPDVIKTGFVEDSVKDAGVAGAELLVQPSYFESFSIVLCEAWAAGVPALVQGRAEVLLGQCRRSGGGLPYWDYPEFEAALDRLLEDEPLRRRLGRAGRAYVAERYSWERVMGEYEGFVARVAASGLSRPAKTAP